MSVILIPHHTSAEEFAAELKSPPDAPASHASTSQRAGEVPADPAMEFLLFGERWLFKPKLSLNSSYFKLRICIRTYMCIYIYIYLYLFIYLYLYLFIYIYFLFIYIYICIYSRTYAYTYAYA